MLVFAVGFVIANRLADMAHARSTHAWRCARAAERMAAHRLVDGRLLLALPLALFVVAGLTRRCWRRTTRRRRTTSASLQAPSLEHLLGTDQLGRDELSRLLFGARTSLSLAPAVLAIIDHGGVALGIACRLRGRPARPRRAADHRHHAHVPSLIVALAILGMRGTGTGNLVLALAVTGWPPFARLARAQVVSMRRSAHIDALRVLGARRGRILSRHLLPATAGPVLVYASIDLGIIVLRSPTLSFLGLGIAPPQPEWGQMLVDARPFLDSALWLALPPGIAITGVVLSGNLLGEHLGGGDRRISPRAVRRRTRRADRCARRRRRAERRAPCTRSEACRSPSGRGRLRAPRGCPTMSATRSRPARRSRSSARARAGRPSRSSARSGCCAVTAQVRGSARLRGIELLGLDDAELRAVRGRRIGVVFQDALAALNPCARSAPQLDDAV